MCGGVALVADVMDRQTEVLGELASEVHGLRRIVEHLSSSSASSLQGAASGDTGPESAWDEDEEVREDEETKEDEEMWMDDERVELQVHGEGEESSDARRRTTRVAGTMRSVRGMGMMRRKVGMTRGARSLRHPRLRGGPASRILE